MSNRAGGLHRKQQHLARLDYLRAWPQLLARLPGANDNVTDEQHDALNDALRVMTHVRLYSPNNENRKTRWGIRLLVSELRGETVTKDQRFKS